MHTTKVATAEEFSEFLSSLVTTDEPVTSSNAERECKLDSPEFDDLYFF